MSGWDNVEINVAYLRVDHEGDLEVLVCEGCGSLLLSGADYHASQEKHRRFHQRVVEENYQ